MLTLFRMFNVPPAATVIHVPLKSPPGQFIVAFEDTVIGPRIEREPVTSRSAPDPTVNVPLIVPLAMFAEPLKVLFPAQLLKLKLPLGVFTIPAVVNATEIVVVPVPPVLASVPTLMNEPPPAWLPRLPSSVHCHR